MKKNLLSLLFIGVCNFGLAQSKDEAAILKLDSLEVASFLKNDTETLVNKIWTKEYVVMNPFNNIVNIKDILALMQNQKITQIPFTRKIEKITISEKIAFVMGVETPDASKAVAGVPKSVFSPRRFTNVWTKTKKGWRLSGRQASNLIEMPNSQLEIETEIRRLENLEREAVMAGDSLALFGKIWSANMIINAPNNISSTVERSKSQLRSGNLAYTSFERNIEKISININIAIVMGQETLKPQGIQQNAGKTVTRRFTNIWQYSNGQWQIIGRQATIIKVE